MDHACCVDIRNENGFNDGNNCAGVDVGDGDQFVSTAGHPLHHLLVGHQRQFSPSKVHIPPNNNDNDGALDSVQKGYDLAQIQQSAAEKLNTSVQIHFAMRMSTLEATFDKV